MDTTWSERVNHKLFPCKRSCVTTARFPKDTATRYNSLPNIDEKRDRNSGFSLTLDTMSSLKIDLKGPICGHFFRYEIKDAEQFYILVLLLIYRFLKIKYS